MGALYAKVSLDRKREEMNERQAGRKKERKRKRKRERVNSGIILW